MHALTLSPKLFVVVLHQNFTALDPCVYGGRIWSLLDLNAKCDTGQPLAPVKPHKPFYSSATAPVIRMFLLCCKLISYPTSLAFCLTHHSISLSRIDMAILYSRWCPKLLFFSLRVNVFDLSHGTRVHHLLTFLDTSHRRLLCWFVSLFTGST